MTNRDKLGAAVMITLFAIFFAIMYWTVTPPASSPGSFENNVIIEQRVPVGVWIVGEVVVRQRGRCVVREWN